MPPGLEEAAKWGPPYVALYFLVWGIWKAGKWTAWRFLDDEEGLITGWFRAQQKLFKEQTDATAAITNSIHETHGAVAAVQRRIDRVIAAAINPTEQSHLIDILVDDSPVPMALVSEDGHFIRTNEAMEDLLGYTKPELAGMLWQQVTPNASDAAVDSAICATIADGSQTGDRLEKTYRRKDGSTIYCALYIRRFPRTGPFRHFVSIVVPLQPERQIR